MGNNRSGPTPGEPPLRIQAAGPPGDKIRGAKRTTPVESPCQRCGNPVGIRLGGHTWGSPIWGTLGGPHLRDSALGPNLRDHFRDNSFGTLFWTPLGNHLGGPTLGAPWGNHLGDGHLSPAWGSPLLGTPLGNPSLETALDDLRWEAPWGTPLGEHILGDPSWGNRLAGRPAEYPRRRTNTEVPPSRNTQGRTQHRGHSRGEPPAGNHLGNTPWGSTLGGTTLWDPIAAHQLRGPPSETPWGTQNRDPDW